MTSLSCLIQEKINNGSNRNMAFCIQRSQETQRILIQILTYKGPTKTRKEVGQVLIWGILAIW